MSSKDAVKLQREIEQFALELDRDIFISLLLIRKISKTYIPFYGQLEISFFFTEHQEELPGHTAWDIIANSQRGESIAAIVSALRLLSASAPFLSGLAKAVKYAKADEAKIRQMIDLLSSLPFDSISLTAVYEYFVKNGTRTGLIAAGDFYTPLHVVQFMVELLDMKEGDIYDPCCGSGAMLYEASQIFYNNKGLRVYGQTMDRDSYWLCQANFLLHGSCINLGGRPANTLLEDLFEDQQFDYIITNPPFNLSNWYCNENIMGDKRWKYGLPPRTNANFAWLQHIISHLKPDGHAAVILPNGTLTTQLSQEGVIRRGILCDYMVEAIIALPEKLFYNTRIPCCIWFINKSNRANSDILLIDARYIKFTRDKVLDTQNIQEIQELFIRHRKGFLKDKTGSYVVVSLDEIAQQNYVLSPNLYTTTEKIPLIPINQIRTRFIELIDLLCFQCANDPLGTLIGQWKQASITVDWERVLLSEIYELFGGVLKSKKAFGHGFPMVDTKVVLQYPFLPDQLTAYVEVSEEEIHKYNIKCGDILLNRTSETVDELACCSVATTDHHAVYGSFIKRLRPIKEDTVNPLFMAGYFRSAVYRQEVKRVSPVYTTRVNINIERLSRILIYYPNLEIQNQIGDTLFSVFQYQKSHMGEKIAAELQEFTQLLIEQFITYPIMQLQEER